MNHPITLISILMLAVAFVVQRTSGQDANANNDRPVDSLEYSFVIGYDGVLQVRAGIERRRRPNKEFGFLKSAKVVDELELSRHQTQELSLLLDRIERDIVKFKPKVSPNGELIKVEKSEFVKWQKEMQSELDDVLLPHQWKRLAQIECRFRIRRNGLVTSLISGVLAKELNLSPDQRREVLSNLASARERVVRASAEAKQTAIDELLAVLSNSQRKELSEKLGAFLDPTRINFEVLVWQLNSEESFLSKSFASGSFAGLREPNSFEIDIDGTLKLGNHLAPEKVPVFDYVLELLNQKAMVHALALVEEQRRNLNFLEGQARQTHNELDYKLQLKIESGKATRSAVNELRKKKRELQKSIEGQIEDILLPHQYEMLERFIENISISRRGLLVSLVNGSLGSQLKVSREQKERLIKTANKVRTGLISKSLELEEEIYKALSSSLQPQKKKRLSTILGPAIKHSYAMVDLLAARLPRQRSTSNSGK